MRLLSANPIALFVFLIACEIACTESSILRHDEREQRVLQGLIPLERHLLHANDTQVEHVLRDWLPWKPDVPSPELYYRDLPDGSRQFIWPYESTLPRDVLAGRLRTWLCVVLDINKNDDLLLVHLLEHYSRLGIPGVHMLFLIQADDKQHLNVSSLHGEEFASSSDELRDRVVKVEKALKHFGADYRVLLASNLSMHERYKVLLLSIQKIPLRDWIIMVNGNEFVDFEDGQTAEEYFSSQERQGANWAVGSAVPRAPVKGPARASLYVAKRPSVWMQFPLQCSFGSNNERVVAFRGLLRPDLASRFVISAEQAEDYYANLETSANLYGNKDHTLYHFTPYSSWWQFYKTELVVGNAYLWYDRKAGKQVSVYRFENQGVPGECTDTHTASPKLPPLSKENVLLLSIINYFT